MQLDKAVSRVVRQCGGVTDTCDQTGLHPAYLYRLMNGERTNPSDDTLAVLGIERRTDYRVVS